jgi:diguanylate cyclase (GGDEF)-like protein/PAS domain S-box-containing protein
MAHAFARSPVKLLYLRLRSLITGGLSWPAWAFGCALLAGAYAVAGRLGLSYARLGADATLLWAPAGIALAALLRVSPALWPGLFAGALAVAAWEGAPRVAALPIAAGNTIVVWSTVLLLRRLGFRPQLDRRRDLWLLVSLGAGASTLLAATNGVGWLLVEGLLTWPRVPAAWSQWWLRDAMGVLMVGVPLLTWAPASARQAFGGWRGPITLLLVATVMASGAAGLLSPGEAASRLTLLVFVPPVLLCWLAIRSGIALASTTVLLLAAAASAATLHSVGPFYPIDMAQGLSLLGGYLASLSAISLLVAALLGELSTNEARWQLALERGQLGVFDWHLPTGSGFTSRLWKLALADAAPGMASWLARVHSDDAPRLRDAIEGLSRGDEGFRVELRMRAPEGGWRWFESHVMVTERDGRDGPARMMGVLVDVTEQQTAQERQRLSASLFQHLHEGLLITDADHRVLDVNPTYSQITGASRKELLGTVPALLQPAAPGTSAHQQQTSMWASLRSVGTWRGEVVERRRNGDPCALQVTISSVLGPDDAVRYHVLVISDITEQRLQRERLERQAHFDELTRLPNRSRMSQMLSDAMAASEREGYLLTVCYLDLDHFKPVNDRYGHAAGDRLLVELGQRLRSALRSSAAWSDSVARLGGDEFVLLLRAATLEECRLAVERVLRVIAQPYAVQAGAEPVRVTASMGATVFPLDRSDADTLLRHADHAMYGAKQSGRNGYLFFDPEHSRRTEARVVAIGRVQEALDNHELRLYFQPKVDMRRGTVLGVEALLRWKHPEHGVIPPGQFLPLIEHTGLSSSVGDWVLEQALEHLAHWHASGLDLSVSVNVSARHLQEPDFAQRLGELLARQKQPLGQRLELEVLESAALADVDHTSDLLERCRRLGVRFSLDDFGTGYSTLTYLKRLPVDVLKIDRSFVHNMLDDAQDLAIVEGVIGLARTFGCSVIAEGVESPAQARTLIELGCDFGQGAGIASPMPADEVLGWVKEYRGLFSLSTAVSNTEVADATAPRAAASLNPD